MGNRQRWRERRDHLAIGLQHWIVVHGHSRGGSGPGGEALRERRARFATNAAYTIPQNYTGYWHVGWGYETGWADAPTSSYFNGSLSEVAYLPSVLSGTQLSTLYGETSVSTLSTYMTSLGPNSYWALQDSATSVCGTTEITVQEKLGATSTCIFPRSQSAPRVRS